MNRLRARGTTVALWRGVSSDLLIVEDEDSIAFAMERFLARRGFAVDLARDVANAVTLLDARSYGVVVTDLRLEASTRGGLDVIAHARAASPHTRTILLTARGGAEIEREALALGTDRVLSKPTPLHDLAAVIEHLMEAC